MTTYRLSRRTPVDRVACRGKEKQQVIISKQHNYAHYKDLVYENTAQKSYYVIATMITGMSGSLLYSIVCP